MKAIRSFAPAGSIASQRQNDFRIRIAHGQNIQNLRRRGRSAGELRPFHFVDKQKIRQLQRIVRNLRSAGRRIDRADQSAPFSFLQ